MSTLNAGRRWAYLGAALGAVVSIAANIAHSFVPPAGVAVESWSPNLGAVIGAVFWPVALFVATEILTRVVWPTGWTWRLLRWAGMLPVAAVAALVSYRHLSGLLAFYGEEPLVCVLGPLAVDGLMVMATGAILATGHTTKTDNTPAPVPGSVPAAPGITARPAPTPTINPSTIDTPVRVPVDPTPEPQPASADARPVVPSPAVVASRITGADATSPAGSATALRGTTRKPSPRPSTPAVTPVGKLAAPATDIPVNAPEPAQLALPIVAPELLNRAREVARQYRTEHRQPITAGQLAVRLKVTSEQATQALAVLNLSTDSPTQPIKAVNGHRPNVAISR